MLQIDSDFLRGSIPPLITPFHDGEVDYDTYAKLVEFQATEGSNGILVNGTTSEPSSLTVAERNRVIDVAVEAAAGRVTVVAATGSQSLAETAELTQHAVANPGVDALLIVTPYYSRPPQRGLVEYYRQLNELHDKPWMIYHIPGRAAVNVEVPTVQEIDRTCPTFVGLKHASTDLGFVAEALATVNDDLRIFVGLEELSLPMMAVGACGLMNAVGNLRPQPLVELCDAMRAGDLHTAQSIHRRLYEVNKAVFFDINPIPMKCMMRLEGLLPTNEHRPPLVPATAELEQRLAAVLKGISPC